MAKSAAKVLTDQPDSYATRQTGLKKAIFFMEKMNLKRKSGAGQPLS